MTDATVATVIDADRPAPLRLRHRPVQRRGKVRFEGILQASRELLRERGIEGFVVEDVAERAGIPVGSVYQFFPNKLAIVAELSEVDTQALTQILIDAASEIAFEDWRLVVDDLFALVLERWVLDPSRSAVWLAMKSTAATRSMAAEQSRRVALLLAPLLGLMNPALSPHRLEVSAEVLVEAVQSILLLAFRGPEPSDEVMLEAKRVVRAYLRAVSLDR
ncbi:MAG: TetR/AcrR family transcriptional regulator [Actinomycetia bacterium]|nr:TetR/AcrR family transcriptional regulator [Actinomycetes bacterium]